jgi:hypothetical protein
MKVKYTIVVEKELDPSWYPEGTDITAFEMKNADPIDIVCGGIMTLTVEEIK